MLELIVPPLVDAAKSAATAYLADKIQHGLKGAPEDVAAIRLRDRIATTSKASELLNQHFLDVKQWCSTIAFLDLRESKPLSGVYVELDAYLMPVRTHLVHEERSDRHALRDLLRKATGHVVILGAPGAGKSTSLKMLCLELLSGLQPVPNIHLPLVIRLREESVTGLRRPILETLQKIIPLSLVTSPDGMDAEIFSTQPILDEAYIEYIQNLNALIVLDGLDEMSSQASKDSLLADFRLLARRLTKCTMILTSRSGEFPYSIQAASIYEIAPLTEGQIELFAARWLRDPAIGKAFTTDLLDSPFADTAIRPLSLAHLCAIYERSKRIPDQPKWVYRKIVTLLIEKWDEQQSIKRVTKYSHFDSGKKFDFLCSLAFHLTVERSTTLFGRDELAGAYKAICRNFKLPTNEAFEVAEEIEAHTGLFIEAAYERYEFAHKSIQEYLVAEFINRSSLRTIVRRIGHLANEVAIAVSISVDPTKYLAELVLTWVSTAPSIPPDFLSKFLTRLAVERPLFYPSKDGVLAYIVLAAMGSDPTLLLPLADLICGEYGRATLDEYYEVDPASAARIQISRRIPHPDFTLPSSVYVPRELLEALQ